MNFRPLLFLSALGFAVAPLAAQTAESELPESSASQPDPFGDTLQLIPDQPQPTEQPDFGEPDLPGSSAVRQSLEPPKPSETRLAIEKQQREIRTRQARIQAERDEELRALLQQGDAARTDAERRYAMKAYYDRLYALILKIDPTLRQDELEARKTEAVAPMKQNEIRASVWQPGDR